MTNDYQRKIRPVIYISASLLVITLAFLWWLFSNGPYPLLTLNYKSETERILIDYWRTKSTRAFPPPRVAVVSIFEHTDECSIVSAILYFRQGRNENAIENPSGMFYKLANEDKKWSVTKEKGGSDLRQQPSDLTCKD